MKFYEVQTPFDKNIYVIRGEETHLILQTYTILPMVLRLLLLCTLAAVHTSRVMGASLFKPGWVVRGHRLPPVFSVPNQESTSVNAGVPGLCGRLWAVFNLI